MTQRGDLTGIGFAWHSDVGRAAGLRLSGTIRRGETDYDGQTQNGTPATSEADDAIYELGGRFGISLSEDVPLFAYAGLAWRYWDQDLKDGRTEDGEPVSGYERYHSYLFAPLGLRFAPDVGEEWQFSLQGELRPLLWGEAGADLPDDGQLRMSMNSGSGIALTLRLERPLDGSGLDAVFGELGWTYWDIDRSDVESLGDGRFAFEPANRTQETTLSLGVRF